MSTLIVNGPPGSGKSTVARLLAGESRRGVHLPADVFWHFIVGHVPPGLPEAEEQNQSVITALASASAVYDRGDYEVFVDGFVRPAYLEIFLETYGRRPLDHVVLMPSLETAVQRACARGESDPTVLLTSDELAAPELIAEQVERRYALFADTPNILATDGLTTEQTAAAIRAYVHSGRARINPEAARTVGDAEPASNLQATAELRVIVGETAKANRPQDAGSTRRGSR